MKILIIHNRYLYPGGEDQVVQDEKELLEQSGHNVYLYERANDELNTYSFARKIRFSFNEVYYSNESYKQVVEILKRERPDIAHIHNPFLLITPSVYKACFNQGVPIVQTLHNYRFLCPIGTFYRDGHICEDCLTSGRFSCVRNRCWKSSFGASLMLAKVIDSYYQKEILSKAIAQFIVPSEFSRTKFIDNGFQSKNLVVKPNFLTEDPGLSDQSNDYAIFVGSFQSYKGIETLLKAWGQLKHKFALKLIGSGPLLEPLKKKYGSAHIEYFGQMSSNEVINYIKKARFLIAPSECYETFSRVIIEAFACGVPVIASEIGALKELVTPDKNGFLFAPGNANELSDKMNTLINDADLADQMGKNARKEFEERFTRQKNYEMLMDVYQKAIGS